MNCMASRAVGGAKQANELCKTGQSGFAMPISKCVVFMWDAGPLLGSPHRQVPSAHMHKQLPCTSTHSLVYKRSCTLTGSDIYYTPTFHGNTKKSCVNLPRGLLCTPHLRTHVSMSWATSTRNGAILLHVLHPLSLLHLLSESALCLRPLVANGQDSRIVRDNE